MSSDAKLLAGNDLSNQLKLIEAQWHKLHVTCDSMELVLVACTRKLTEIDQ